MGKENSNYITCTFCKIDLNFLGFFQYDEGLVVKEILHCSHSQKYLPNANVSIKSCVRFEETFQIQHCFNFTGFFGTLAELSY